VVSANPASAAAPVDDFTQAALNAVKKWSFEPERVDGHGVAGSVEIPIYFQIEGARAAKSGAGVVRLPGGGKLNVYLSKQVQSKREQLGVLADSKVRIRSIKDAQSALDGI